MKKFNKNFTVTIKMDSKFKPKYMPYLDTFESAIYNKNKKEFILCTIDTLNKVTQNIEKYIEYTFNKTDGTYEEKITSYFVKKFAWLKDAEYSEDSVFDEKDNKLIFKSGTWIDGYWFDGIWEDGIWEKGIWRNGIWENGVWKDGIWYKGTWEYGTWEDGIWKNGVWKNGIWKDGSWEKGTWEKGTWRDGIWNNGIWKDGVWKNGEWYKGTWEKGTWEKGEGKPENA
jgi:hypothetical protein